MKINEWKDVKPMEWYDRSFSAVELSLNNKGELTLEGKLVEAAPVESSFLLKKDFAFWTRQARITKDLGDTLRCRVADTEEANAYYIACLIEDERHNTSSLCSFYSFYKRYIAKVQLYKVKGLETIHECAERFFKEHPISEGKK